MQELHIFDIKKSINTKVKKQKKNQIFGKNLVTEKFPYLNFFRNFKNKTII